MALIGCIQIRFSLNSVAVKRPSLEPRLLIVQPLSVSLRTRTAQRERICHVFFLLLGRQRSSMCRLHCGPPSLVRGDHRCKMPTLHGTALQKSFADTGGSSTLYGLHSRRRPRLSCATMGWSQSNGLSVAVTGRTTVSSAYSQEAAGTGHMWLLACTACGHRQCTPTTTSSARCTAFAQHVPH